MNIREQDVRFVAMDIPDELLRDSAVDVPVALLRDCSASLASKAVYAMLLWYASRLGYYPGTLAMAKEFGIPRRSLERHLQELEEFGLIEATNAPRLGEPVRVRITAPSEWRSR